MPDPIQVRIDGATVSTVAGANLAVLLIEARDGRVRSSPLGQVRGPWCGIGQCWECRATVDGVPHTRTCRVVCRDGMEVETGA